MSTSPQDGSQPTVVLVHGGFADGSGWQGVYNQLKDDYSVRIVQNPTLSLEGDVAATKSMIPPPAQRWMSERAGSTVEEAAGSHAIYVSQPAAVAALIEKAASEVSTAAR